MSVAKSFEQLPIFLRNHKSFCSATVGKFESNWPTGHCNFLSFLALCQHQNVDIYPLTWYAGLGSAGEGGTASINQATISHEFSFAFKRWSWNDNSVEEIERMYAAMMAEVLVLSQPAVRASLAIIDLEGVCFERKEEGYVPVLVFERAQYGDLVHFMCSSRGHKTPINERIELLRQIANGLSLLHKQRECFPLIWFEVWADTSARGYSWGCQPSQCTCLWRFSQITGEQS